MEKYELILKKLLELPGSLSAGQDQIRIVCPVCKNVKAKCYVGIHKRILQEQGKKILGYECKHCLFHGLVGPKFFKTLGIEVDKDTLESMKFHKEIIKTINPVTKMEKLDIKIPDFIRPEDKFKIDYLSKRFGRKVTIQDIKKYKIVVNFRDLYQVNNLNLFSNLDQKDPEYTKKRNYLKFLGAEFADHFVGMLSVDNNKINLRNINSEKLKSKRYMVHVINKNIGNPYMYMPDIPVDLLATEPVINMAEGNYDIIGAKELFFLNENYDNIFVAIGTRAAYKRVLNQILKMTGFLNAKINIFADFDNDSTDIESEEGLKWYKELFQDYRCLFNEINIIYNTAKYKDENGIEHFSKDFGDLSKPVSVKSIVI